MASVKYSGIGITNLKGKIGGSVAQGGPYGNIIHALSRPTPFATPNTNSQRTHFGLIAEAWYALSPTDRATWVTAAPNWIFTNRFGDPITLSAYDLFQSCSLNLMNMGIAPNSVAVNTPPSSPIFGGALLAPILPFVFEFNFDTIVNPMGENWYYQLEVTPPLSSGVTNFKSKLKTVWYPRQQGLIMQSNTNHPTTNNLYKNTADDTLGTLFVQSAFTDAFAPIYIYEFVTVNNLGFVHATVQLAQDGIPSAVINTGLQTISIPEAGAAGQIYGQYVSLFGRQPNADELVGWRLTMTEIHSGKKSAPILGSVIIS